MDLTKAQRLQQEQEYSDFLRTHRFSKEGIFALSNYFNWNILHEDLLIQINDKQIIDTFLSQCPEDVKHDFLALYRFRDKLLPMCVDYYGQSEYTYFRNKFFPNGSYNFDRTDMLASVSQLIDLELNAPLHREYEEDYNFWKPYLSNEDEETCQ